MVWIRVGCVPRTIFLIAEGNEKIRKKGVRRKEYLRPDLPSLPFSRLFSFLSATATGHESRLTEHDLETADERG